ncbi:MAG: hypothetical protein ACRDQX_00595 [Pseudonocardiaceae bacterium]
MSMLWFVRPVRWARSPLDHHAHLLPEDGEHPQGGLTARCGHRLPVTATVHTQPPAWRCPSCDLIFEADVVNSPPRFARHHPLPRMLSGTELVDWMALSRVHAGRVTQCHGEYLDAGQPMPQTPRPRVAVRHVAAGGTARAKTPG